MTAEVRRFYRFAEVAEMLGTSQVTVYGAIREGEFPAVPIRGRWIVPAEAVVAVVAAALSTGRAMDVEEWTSPAMVPELRDAAQPARNEQRTAMSLVLTEEDVDRMA